MGEISEGLEFCNTIKLCTEAIKKSGDQSHLLVGERFQSDRGVDKSWPIQKMT